MMLFTYRALFVILCGVIVMYICAINLSTIAATVHARLVKSTDLMM